MKKKQLLNVIACFIFAVMTVVALSNLTSKELYAAEVESSTEETTKIDIPKPNNLRITMTDYVTNFSFRMPSSFDTTDLNLCYHIQCDKNANWDNPEYDYYTYDNNFNFYWLTFGEKYYFRVRAEVNLYDGYTWLGLEVSDWTNPISKVVRYNPVTLNSAVSQGAQKVKLTWDISYDGEGYRIYRSTSENGEYKLIKTIKDIYTTTFTNTNLTPGTKYYYKVCTYDSSLTFPNGQFSAVKEVTPKPAKKTLTAVSAGRYSIKLSWSKGETGVDGYRIYRSDTKNGKYISIATITDINKVTFTNTKRTFAKYYYYKIRSFSEVNGKKVFGSFSDIVQARATVGQTQITSIKQTTPTKATIKWNKVAYASGYRIYMSTTKNGEYKSIKTINGNNTFEYTTNKILNGNRYYFKIKAFRTVDGTRYYGSFSDVKSRMMNKYGYEYESYYSRAQRIFGTYYYKEYTSASSAKKDMTTIKIKTWDINSSGKKYTRYHYLTVHKNIAGTVKEIFKEIYNGDEKFPIKSVGGYSWRGDTSSSEHCEGLAIDINPNENAQFSGSTGKPLVGSLYKPGVNPYSIPANGDVVNAFEKFGFSWGNWFYNPDYMHFSYFGR